MSFVVDWTGIFFLLLLGGVAFVLWRWGRTFVPPQLYFSQVEELPQVKWNDLPQKLKMVSLAFFALAFIDPHIDGEREEIAGALPIKETHVPTEGVAIYLVLDKSGSMSQRITARTPEGSRERISKMELLQRVTRDFVERRPGDLIGLVSFARGAQVMVPLTLDHAKVQEELDTIDYVREKEQDGTAIGYAIYKTANLIAATRHYGDDQTYKINSAVMILVTDGFQSPSELDKGKRLRNIEMVEAAAFARGNDVKLYIINVEPRLNEGEFALQRELMQKIAQLTGGGFYSVRGTQGLEEIYGDIDRLEKSILPVKVELGVERVRQVSLFPYLIALGMVVLFLGLFLEAAWFRRVP